MTAGIVALELFSPGAAVCAASLEQAHGVDGKYTNGLWMREFACVDDCDDAVSMAVTAVGRLLRRHGVAHDRVRGLFVGSESHADLACSTKTRIAEALGYGGLAGGDVYNACFGGTAALFAALDFVDAAAGDGECAIVVASDISDPPAEHRFMRGAAAVAILVGHDPSLAVTDRVSFARNTWDFCKPLAKPSMAPVMRASQSVHDYAHALERCYARLSARHGHDNLLDGCDYLLFHLGSSPKFVWNAFERLCRVAYGADVDAATVERVFDAKVRPALDVPSRIGPMHTAALYATLTSLSGVARNARLMCFSYGSGCAAALFLCEGTVVGNDAGPMLDARERVAPAEFERRAARYDGTYGRVGWRSHSRAPSTAGVLRCDDHGRRHYALADAQ